MREFQRFLPTGWKERPTTVLDVLRAAKAVLEDEQNWIKECFFKNNDPSLDPDDAYCNHWQVCALGAIGIVTIGNYRKVPPSDAMFDGPHGIPSAYRWMFLDDAYENRADRELYNSAASVLEDALFSEGFRNGIVEFNDHDATTHAQVMTVFDKAIELAQMELTERETNVREGSS